jgi:sporulation integral membrane protein YtvI
MSEQAKRGLRALLSVAAAGLALWIALRFLLPWLGPFLLALALASLLEPGVRALIRHGWRRGLAAALLTLLLLGLLFWGLAELGTRCLSAAASLTRELPRLMQAMAQSAARMEERLLRLTASAPEELRDYLDLALQSFGEALGALPLQLSQWLLSALSRFAQSGPDLLLFTVTAGLGTYFLSASFPKSMAFLRAQLPDALANRLRELRTDLRGSFGGLLRTQLLLMGLCFLELLAAFRLLGTENNVGLAAMTALVDALPVFGTGTVLLPWAAAELLLGEGGRALGLVGCWGGTNLVRNCVQARLLGGQIGLSPIASLLAVYVGWRICGVGGMLLLPVLLATLQQLNDRGALQLWKSI